MMTNDLLREKYRVQKALDEKANHNLAQYAANAHARIKEIEAKYGVKFKYGKPALTSQKTPNFALQPDALPPGGFAAI
jgi:phage host-nuclease inhibitor protein Gam